MKQKEFKEYVEQILDKHTPTYFIDSDYLQRIITVVCCESEMSRRSIIMLAYSIGANEEETNELLKIKGYECLYVKRREDAIWKFALKMRMDLAEIMEIIFPQNVAEN